jgi:hypothetical protein
VKYLLRGLHFEVAQEFSEALLVDRVIRPQGEIPDVSAVAQLRCPGFLRLHNITEKHGWLFQFKGVLLELL